MSGSGLNVQGDRSFDIVSRDPPTLARRLAGEHWTFPVPAFRLPISGKIQRGEAEDEFAGPPAMRRERLGVIEARSMSVAMLRAQSHSWAR